MSLTPTISIEGQSVPRLIYGTAWKEEQTEDLVREALLSGFMGIDTANQRKHYYEVGVGRGLKAYCDVRGCARENLFLQTKFTFQNGQDDRLPYDPTSDFRTQVRQSFESSCQHLGVKRIDSYVLHGPFHYGQGQLSSADFESWSEMEKLKDEGFVKFLAVSNFGINELTQLLERARHKPQFVQNRCFASSGWDRRVRKLCEAHGILYQGFSLLTANLEELNHNIVKNLCEKYQKTVPQIVFRFCLQKNMMVLTGTTNILHMTQDLDVFNFSLSEEEVLMIENIAEK